MTNNHQTQDSETLEPSDCEKPNPVKNSAESCCDRTPQSQDCDLENEAKTLRDQLLRALADAENTRRRMQKQIEDAGRYAVSEFAREMLGIADTFQRALEAIPNSDGQNAAITNLVEGLRVTERQLMSAFEKFGITRLEPLGTIFDPHKHRVMVEVDDPTRPAGTVAKVLQPGYVIQDRLLREALVAVVRERHDVPAQGHEGAKHPIDALV